LNAAQVGSRCCYSIF